MYIVLYRQDHASANNLLLGLYSTEQTAKDEIKRNFCGAYDFKSTPDTFMFSEHGMINERDIKSVKFVEMYYNNGIRTVNGIAYIINMRSK